MVTCNSPYVRVEVVQLLLEAGADPGLADKRGCTQRPYSVTWTWPTCCTQEHYHAEPLRCQGSTALFYACTGGHKSMVSKLLSLGAMQPISNADVRDTCPRSFALQKGFVGVVRVLINEGGIRAARGGIPLTEALYTAIDPKQTIIFRLLPVVEGEEGRSEWANSNMKDTTNLLHIATGLCYPAAVSVLLEAGADETARDPEGRIPRDVIGQRLGRDDEPQMDREKETAIDRMLQRGPAYRARSWAWRSDTEEADAGGSGDRYTAGAAGAVAVLSSPPAVNPPPLLVCESSGRRRRALASSS